MNNPAARGQGTPCPRRLLRPGAGDQARHQKDDDSYA